MHLVIVFTIICLIGLSSQQQCSQLLTKHNIQFPINAISIIRGETKDPVTNELCKISGLVRFEQLDCSSNVTIQVDIVGLPKNKILERGLHIHSYAISDASDNITAVCGSTGPHFNPTNVTHGLLTSPIRHAGDLGNVVANENGSISVQFENNMISLYDHQFSVIGRSIVLHELTDDGGLGNSEASRLSGTSGMRIACGDIGLVKPVGQIVEREFLQGISPVNNILSDIQDKVRGSWIFDFIKSQVNALKQNNSTSGDADDSDAEDDDEDQVQISVLTRPSNEAASGLMYQIWSNFVRTKQEFESLFNDDINTEMITMLDGGEKKKSTN